MLESGGSFASHTHVPPLGGDAVSLFPILWAVEHAATVDAEERAILVALVIIGDFDGCNCYRSFATLARVARVDRRTAMRKVQAMTDRGILREQKDPPPRSEERRVGEEGRS